MSYIYPGISQFCSYWADAPMLQQCFQALETSLAEDNDGVVGNCKGLLETGCILLLSELDDPMDPYSSWEHPINKANPGAGHFVSAVVKIMGLSDARDDPLNKLVSQHHKMVEVLDKVRNCADPFSHGKPPYLERLAAYHRQLVVSSTDAVITFLHEAFLNKDPDPRRSRQAYDKFNETNSLIDTYCLVDAEPDGSGFLNIIISTGGEEIPLTVSASELLFALDREGYVTAGKMAGNAEGRDRQILSQQDEYIEDQKLEEHMTGSIS